MAKGVPEKRLRKAIGAILEQRPRKLWGEILGLFGLALGFGSWLYMLLSPHPRFYLGFLLTLGCSCSLVVAFYLLIPGRPRLKVIVGLLLVCASALAYWRFAPLSLIQAYPWLFTRVWYPDSRGDIIAIRPQLEIKEYPTTPAARNGILPLSNLDHLHLSVSMPLMVSPSANGWTPCMLADIGPIDWNNDDASRHPLGFVNLQRDVMILEVRATAKNAAWTGAVILSKRGKTVNSEEYISGYADGVAMSVLETYVDGRTTVTDDGARINITRDLLLKYGVPTGTPTAEQTQRACAEIVRPPTLP